MLNTIKGHPITNYSIRLTLLLLYIYIGANLALGLAYEFTGSLDISAMIPGIVFSICIVAATYSVAGREVYRWLWAPVLDIQSFFNFNKI